MELNRNCLEWKEEKKNNHQNKQTLMEKRFRQKINRTFSKISFDEETMRAATHYPRISDLSSDCFWCYISSWIRAKNTDANCTRTIDITAKKQAAEAVCNSYRWICVGLHLSSFRLFNSARWFYSSYNIKFNCLLHCMLVMS